MAEPAKQLKVLERKPAEAINLESYRLQQRARLLGKLAVETADESLQSNDGLAPVFKLLETGSSAEAEAQIKLEYITDMGERAKKRHVNKKFGWAASGGDLLASDSGISYREMMAGGLNAARVDTERDSRWNYALAQAETQVAHLDKILEWYTSDDLNCVIINSLCPDNSELPETVARLLNFKPDKKMSMNWLFAKTSEGITMHAFSLDGLTLKGLDHIYQELETGARPKATALGQLAELTSLPYTDGDEAVEVIRRLHDERLDRENPSQVTHYFGTKNNFEAVQDANGFVETKPQAYEAYKRAVIGLADSFKTGRVSDGLAGLARELKSGFASDNWPNELSLPAGVPISLEQGRDFMEYLRRNALPHYIYEGDNLAVGYESSGGVSVAAAGADALSGGYSYDSGCPGASGVGPAAAAHANAERAAAMNVQGRQEFSSRWCPNCLPSPRGTKSVRAWRQGEHIGCKDCGHVVDVCTGTVVKRGRQLQKTKNQIKGGFDSAGEAFSRDWQRLKTGVKLGQVIAKRSLLQRRAEKGQIDELALKRLEKEEARQRQILKDLNT